jgi:hypothetical protein
MPQVWFKKLMRDNPILADVYHRLCMLNVGVDLPCSEDDVKAVMSGNGHGVKEAKRIMELYWLCMKNIMTEHETRMFLQEEKVKTHLRI